MKWTSLSWILLLILYLLAFLPPGAHAQPPRKGEGPPPAPVEVFPVLKKKVRTRVTLVGTAEPWLETKVAAQVEGLVTKILVDEGDRVKKGQLLCQQEASQLKIKIQAARAALAEAQIQYAQSQREWERQKRLFASRSTSEKAYDNARFLTRALEKRVVRLKTQLLELQDQLAKKSILSPVEGYVIKRHTQVGQWLPEGGAVVTISVLDPIRLMVPVPERYIHQVQIASKVQVSFDGLPGHTFQGLVAAVIPQGDRAARTFPIRIRISNRDGYIKAGMLARVNLAVGRLHLALLVPKDALVLSSGGTLVYVVNGERARPVPIHVETAHGPFVEVRGDLKPGMKVVVRGNERLRPGQPVRAMPSSRSYKLPSDTGAT